MDRATTCCFTGHRPDKLPWGYDENHPACLDLKSRIAEALDRAYQRGYRHFICGMALGCDLYFCEAALALRRDLPGVTVEAAVPCEEQDKGWREEEQARYRRLLGECDFETLVQRAYTPGCMQRRDRYMVDRSSLVIAAYDGRTSGGTLYTLRYAMKQGVDLLVLGAE